MFTQVAVSTSSIYFVTYDRGFFQFSNQSFNVCVFHRQYFFGFCIAYSAYLYSSCIQSNSTQVSVTTTRDVKAQQSFQFFVFQCFQLSRQSLRDFTDSISIYQVSIYIVHQLDAFTVAVRRVSEGSLLMVLQVFEQYYIVTNFQTQSFQTWVSRNLVSVIRHTQSNHTVSLRNVSQFNFFTDFQQGSLYVFIEVSTNNVRRQQSAVYERIFADGFTEYRNDVSEVRFQDIVFTQCFDYVFLVAVCITFATQVVFFRVEYS